MADEQGANNLQTEDVNNHAAYGEPLKSPAVTNEMPSVNISNSKEANSADLQEESAEDAEKEEGEENAQGEDLNDCSAENKDGNVDEKEGGGELQEDAELEQGEIADEEEEGMECDEESSEEGSEEGEVESGVEGEEEGEEEEEEMEGEGEEGISYEEDETSLAEAGMSDSEADKCPVCLCPFADQDVGTPESCDHTFCLECILEWSKNVNTCPVDRSLFRAILVRHSVGGEVVRHIDVDEPKAEGEGYEEEDATYCEVCGRCDREDRLLLCDGCDAGYHCECLDPPLDHIPIEEWFCPECVTRNRHQDTVEVEAGDESEDEWTTVEQRPSVVRAIARTRVSERVRAVITRARALRLRDEEEAQPSTSTRRPRASTTRKPKKTTRRRRKTTKGKRRRKTTKSPRGKGKKGKVKKRGTKKIVRRKKGTRKQKPGGVRTVKRTPSTVRGRIAKSLQLVKPRTGSMMPDKKIPVGRKSSMDYRLSEIGAAKLSIKGNDALFYSGDDGYSQQEVAKASLPSTSRSEPVASGSGVPDLLGSIMAGQSILHMKSSDITIHRDGHLSVNKDKDDTSKSSPKKNPGDSDPISKESDNSENNINNVKLFNEQAVEGEGENQSPVDQDEVEDSDPAEDFVTKGLLPSNIRDDSEHKVSDELVNEYENPGNEGSDIKTDDHSTKTDNCATKIDDCDTNIDDGGTNIGDGDTNMDGDTNIDDGDTNIDDGDTHIDDGDTPIDDGDTPIDDGDTNINDGYTNDDDVAKPDDIQNEDHNANVAEKEDFVEKENVDTENVDTVLSDFPKEKENSVDDNNHVQDHLHAGQPDQSESCELENDTLLPPGNPLGDEPNSNDSSDLHGKFKDACEDALLGQRQEVEEGEHQKTLNESHVCNEKSTDEILSTLSGKLEEDGDVNNKETEADTFNKSADEETVVTNAGEGNHGDFDKSAESAAELKDLTNNDSSTDKQTSTDIEVIKVVKGARTVTRKSIPDGSKNPAEAGEIEIIRVDIINKPKRRDRRRGEKGGHASSSSFDSQSDEEGAIREKRNKKGKDHSKMKKKDFSKRHSKDGDAKGKKTGDSSAEEGEVKSDEERAGGKRKKKRNKKKKNKDTRNVIVDSSNPKIVIPELAKTPTKVKLDGKKSDSESGKSRERGGYGDLRQVIQVKRDSLPEDDVRRYEAYWNEYGKRRGDERRVESSSQWEQLYSYSAYSFAEGKQWENFTVQRERSPIYDRRKEKENSSKRIESRRSSRGDRSSGHSRERQYRPEKETMAEKAVRLEREAAKRERQLQETRRGERHLTMAEREARELMRSRMDEHIERKYGKQGFLTEIVTRRDSGHNRNRTTARDKHGRERSYEHDYYRERSRDKSGDRKRLKEKEQKHYEDRSRERKRQRREASRSSRSRDEYSSDRHRSVDKRSYDSDISRSSSRSASVPSDKEPEPPKALPKTSSVPKPTPGLPGQKPDMVTKKKKKDKAKGKKDKKTKEAKKAAKKAKGLKAAAKKDKADATGILAESAAAAAAATAAAAAAAAAAKRPAEGQAIDQAPAKKQKKIKGKKDKKKKKAAKLAKLAAKAGNVPAPRPTCLIQDDEDPDIIDLTGEVEDRSPTPSTPPTPKPATPTKPPPKDPSPIVSSTADIRDSNNPSSSLYDPFEPTASPPVSYSNSPSPITSEGGLQTRKGPSSSSIARVSRGSADREREVNASKRPYSPRDAPFSRRSPQGSPPRATSSSTASSIAKLLPALSSQTNSQINQLLGSISSNPALQSVLSASAGSGHGTSLSGSQRSPSGSEQSFSKVSALGLDSPRQEERRPTKDVDNIGEVNEEDIESSAVDLYNKNSRERYLKKLHHQERVVEEVKLAIKPHYQRREINKEEYKEILRKSVNQVCHSKSGEINPVKIRNLIEGYVKKVQTKRKLGTTMKPLIITSDRSRSSKRSGPNVLGKLIL